MTLKAFIGFLIICYRLPFCLRAFLSNILNIFVNALMPPCKNQTWTGNMRDAVRDFRVLHYSRISHISGPIFLNLAYYHADSAETLLNFLLIRRTRAKFRHLLLALFTPLVAILLFYLIASRYSSILYDKDAIIGFLGSLTAIFASLTGLILLILTFAANFHAQVLTDLGAVARYLHKQTLVAFDTVVVFGGIFSFVLLILLIMHNKMQYYTQLSLYVFFYTSIFILILTWNLYICFMIFPTDCGHPEK